MDMRYYLQQTNSEEVKTWINHNLKNHLSKEGVVEIQGEIEEIVDYLSSEDAPKRLKKMSFEEAKASSDKWHGIQARKGSDIVETSADTEIVLTFEEGFKLVKLVGENAYKREGFLMSHCVGSYVNKDSSIYSLRDFRNNPHCTIEITGDGKNVNQIKGKGNGSIHPNYIEHVLKTLKYFKIDVRDSEMNNLGYSNMDEIEGLSSFIFDNFTGAKTINLNGKVFLYNRSKLVKKTA